MAANTIGSSRERGGPVLEVNSCVVLEIDRSLFTAISVATLLLVLVGPSRAEVHSVTGNVTFSETVQLVANGRGSHHAD